MHGKEKQISIAVLLLVFLYIYNISFIYIPEILRTRVIIGLVGGFLSLKIIFQNTNKYFFYLLIILTIPIIPILATTLINNEFDARFFGNVFQNIIYLFGAFYIIEIIRKKNIKVTPFLLCKYISISIFIHNLLSFLIYLFPSLLSIVIGIQSMDKNFLYAMENTLKFNSRFIGIGIGSYFSGGTISIIGSITCTYVVLKTKNNIIWWIILIGINILGVFIARIAFGGILLSLFLIIRHWYKNKQLNETLFRLLISSFIIITILYVWNQWSVVYKDNPLFKHSFEVFLNLSESNSFQAGSIDHMRDMFIIPDNDKTLLIGDGKFSNPDDSFYMHTDVGYSRLLYYYGIIGAICFFLPFFFLLRYLIHKNNDNDFRYMLYSLMILLLVCNIKGLIDVNWLMFLFFCIYINHKINENSPYYN
jgi:hypothetical protein